jgi:hypothetical protein
MRNSDIIFFGTLFISISFVLISVLFHFNLPQWFDFWWVVLIPVVIFKNFITNNKFSRWLNKNRI